MGRCRRQCPVSANPFDEIIVEEAVRLKEAGIATEVVAISCGTLPPVRRPCVPPWPSAPTAASWSRPTSSFSPGGRHCSGTVDKGRSTNSSSLGKQAIDDGRQQTGQMLPPCKLAEAAAAPRWSSPTASAAVTRESTVVWKPWHQPAGRGVVDLRLNEPRYSAATWHEGQEEPLDTVKPADLASMSRRA